MIKQHIFRRDASDRCHTAAVSFALRESARLPLLEQQTALHSHIKLEAPVYCQHPFGTGLTLSRYAADSANAPGSVFTHQLVADEPDDLALLNNARPLPASLFLDAYDEQGDGPAPLPTLDPAAMGDPELLSTAFRLVDLLFDESLLAALFEALLMVARDKQKIIHIVMTDADCMKVSRQGRLLMEILMRCLPVREVVRLSWCTLLTPDASAMPCSVYISPFDGNRRAGYSDYESRCIRFDLTEKLVAWPEETPAISEKSAMLARALLAHDLNWVDRVREESAAAPHAIHSLKITVPPFERGMSLTQYINDWADTLEIRHSIINEDAFMQLAREEWPHLIGRIIAACDLMPNRKFVSELLSCLVSFSHDRRSSLGMTGQYLLDLTSVLIDSIDWDGIDLLDPDDFQLLRSVTDFVDQLDDELDTPDCLAAYRVMRAVTSGSVAAHLTDAIDALTLLSEDYPALFEKIQGCARRYVSGQCRALKTENDSFFLTDETTVAMSVIGYVRFTGGIPDLRQLDKVRDTVGQLAGPDEARRYSSHLDKLRRRMNASRAVNLARRREMHMMLLISLLLFLVIAGVMLSYFLFLK